MCACVHICVRVCVFVCGVALLIFNLAMKMHHTLKFQRVIDILTVKSFEVMEVMSTLQLIVFAAKQMQC